MHTSKPPPAGKKERKKPTTAGQKIQQSGVTTKRSVQWFPQQFQHDRRILRERFSYDDKNQIKKGCIQQKAWKNILPKL